MPDSSERYLAAPVKSGIARLRSAGSSPWLIPLAIAALPLLYFLPATLGRIVLASDDTLIFGLPLRVTIAQMIRHGHLPLWNPYIFCGMPLFAAAQGGVLFPLNWMFVIVGPRLAMNLAVLASYACAGLGAFFYARRAGANVLGSVVTAVVWQLCGVSIGQISHTSILHVFGVLPWLFWAIEAYRVQPTGARALLISASVAAAAFAGNQQTLAYLLLLASAYAVTIGLTDKNGNWLRPLIFIAAGLFVAAVQLVPTAELLRLSLRDTASYEFFSSFSLPPVFLLTYFAPFVVGGGNGLLFRAPYIGESFYPEYAGYVGLAPLMLAAIAAVIARDARTRFWICTAVLCLLLALGRFSPFGLYRLIYYVPVLNLFRVPARHLMEVDFALAVLAGRGVTFLPAVPRARRLVITAAIGTCMFLLTWATVTWWRPNQFHLARVAPVSILRAPELFMPLLLAGAGGFVLLHFIRGGKLSAPLLAGLIVADLALWGQFTDWRTHSPARNDPIFRAPGVVRWLQHEAQPFRILTLDRTLATALANGPAMTGFDLALQPDICMMHGLSEAAGYDGFGLKRYSRLAGDMKVWGEFPDQPRSLLVSRELDILNVRYLVAAAPQSIGRADATASSRWRQVAAIENEMIYENTRTLPRFWLANDSRALSDEQKLEVIRTGRFADGTAWDPQLTALVDSPLITSGNTAAGEARITRYEPNRVSIAATTSSPAVLILADNYFPGWHVRVDGKPAPLLRVDYNLRGVRLEPGQHIVKFNYRPFSLLLGALISIFTTTCLWLYCRSRRYRT